MAASYSTRTNGGRATREGRSVSDLLSALTDDARLLVRQEVELAKAEVKEEAKTAAKGSAMVAAAAVTGHLALLLLSFALAWGLAALVGPGLGFLIVGIVYAAVAGLLFVLGRDRLQQVEPMPQQTIETLKEDAEWAKDQTR